MHEASDLIPKATKVTTEIHVLNFILKRMLLAMCAAQTCIARLGKLRQEDHKFRTA
jgi:hypothetical protein